VYKDDTHPKDDIEEEEEPLYATVARQTARAHVGDVSEARMPDAANYTTFYISQTKKKLL